jgi:DNA-binding winged helix-turn-helix (wHTH) protein
MRVRFGDWRFESGSRELRRGSEAVHLSPKAFDLLGMLLTARPDAISKRQIQERLWPATFVTESNLTKLMTEIRTALGDDARNPRFVRTLHGFGYAFCGSAEVDQLPAGEAASAASCRLIWGKREILLSEGENVLGRTPDAVVWIESSTVSRRHARILVSGETAVLEDLGSKNGTFLAGKRLTEPAPLGDRDKFCLGSEWMAFRLFRAAASTRTGGPIG